MKRTLAVDKHLVDIDDLLKFLLDDTEGEIDEDCKKKIINCFEFYKNNVSDAPNVEIGQTVWVVRGDYNCEKKRRVFEVVKCVVYKKTIRKRYNFTVTDERYYVGTFTGSSIGKTVFFTEEEAKKKAEKMNK